MREKPKVGQKLFSLNIGNSARNREQVLTPVVVKKVGRKYFTCGPEGKEQPWMQTEYHLDTWKEKTDYSADSKLYESEQEWLDKKECSKICRYIYEQFNYGNNYLKIPLSDLKKIMEIIKSNL